VLSLLVAAALLVGFMVGRASAGPEGPSQHIRSYMVRSGDTVWSIADRVAAGDPRPVVDWLMAENHLSDATIVPGQSLVLPG
jgi:LysM repeat protein